MTSLIFKQYPLTQSALDALVSLTQRPARCGSLWHRERLETVRKLYNMKLVELRIKDKPNFRTKEGKAKAIYISLIGREVLTEWRNFYAL